jgi:hypothetical protein
MRAIMTESILAGGLVLEGSGQLRLLGYIWADEGAGPEGVVKRALGVDP